MAHEWFHALDNYFSRQREQKNLYITDRPRRLINDGANDNTRQELLDAFNELTMIIDLSDYKKRSDKIDSLKSKKYWGTTTELTARAFENYVIDKLVQKNIVNDYLANFKSMSEYLMDINGDIDRLNSFYPYPMEEEAKEFNERFDNLFNTIQEKVENDNVVLFRQSNNDIRFRNIESIKDRNRQVLRIDEYGKNIVWENGDYYIAVDSKDDATYISLWNDNKKIGFLTAQKGIDRINGISPDDILLVGSEIDKKT